MDFVFMMLKSGLEALEDYILAHTLNCLVPAFFHCRGYVGIISKGQDIEIPWRENKGLYFL